MWTYTWGLHVISGARSVGRLWRHSHRWISTFRRSTRTSIRTHVVYVAPPSRSRALCATTTARCTSKRNLPVPKRDAPLPSIVDVSITCITTVHIKEKLTCPEEGCTTTFNSRCEYYLCNHSAHQREMVDLSIDSPVYGKYRRETHLSGGGTLQ